MSAGYVTFAALYVAGVLIRDAYEVLKLRDRIDTRDVRIFAFVFASMCVMWVSWFVMGALAPTRAAIADAVRWVGLAAVGAGTVLAVGGMVQLRGVENIDHLETTGIFAVTRHPMYTGFALWIVGWGVFEASLPNLAIGLLGLVSVLWWRQLEEADMESQYGQDYVAYRARTRF